MAVSMGTSKFVPLTENANTARDILRHVFSALESKGYDPIAQIVGYLLTGDPTYITSHQQARVLICRLERYDILEELVRSYVAHGLPGNARPVE